VSFNRDNYSRWVLLGEGGEARVFRAWQDSVGRQVAIREVKSQGNSRAEREAKILAGLRHQGLAVLIEYGSEKGRFYLVQDYIQGSDPARLAPMPPILAIRCMRSLVATLGYMHSRGLVHGDLHPGNFLVTAPGECVLVDFGMVRRTGEPGGQLLGMPRYLSPEHLEGAPLSTRADIFSCGSLLYFLLTGSHLFHAPEFSQVADSMRSLQNPDTRTQLSAAWLGLPLPVLRVLDGCLHYHPEDRFEDMEELDENLEIAEQELLAGLGRKEHGDILVAAHVQVRDQILQREREAIEAAVDNSMRHRRYSICRQLLEDLLVLGPQDPAVRKRLDQLEHVRNRSRWIWSLAALSLCLVGLAMGAWIWSQNKSPVDEMVKLDAQLIRESMADTGSAEPQPDFKEPDPWRLISIPEADSFDLFLLNSMPQPLENGVLRLHPGRYRVYARIAGSKNYRHGRLVVPDTGIAGWFWR